jgi:hypothetical protein
VYALHRLVLCKSVVQCWILLKRLFTSQLFLHWINMSTFPNKIETDPWIIYWTICVLDIRQAKAVFWPLLRNYIFLNVKRLWKNYMKKSISYNRSSDYQSSSTVIFYLVLKVCQTICRMRKVFGFRAIVYVEISNPERTSSNIAL